MNHKFKDVIQDCNLNFLIGSGLSSPFLSMLGRVEILLNELEGKSIEEANRRFVRASLFKKYFDGAISKNLQIIVPSDESQAVLARYCTFLKTINGIILKRRSSILSKQINLFTTNVDVFLEKALEDLNLEYNDGFSGRFQPSFSLSNFKKSHFRKSLHYDNISEIPVFNLLKLHGSLTWKIADGNKIIFSPHLEPVKEIQEKSILAEGHTLSISDEIGIDTILSDAAGKSSTTAVDAFLTVYDNLQIVNPTKEKFKSTLLNQTYYELLRMYSNELEKENTVLFVMGFSFADEHIREITLRAANSNPTLIIYIIAYDSISKADIEGKLGINNIKNRNIVVIGPPRINTDTGEDEFKYDLSVITARIFEKVVEDETSSAVTESQ